MNAFDDPANWWEEDAEEEEDDEDNEGDGERDGAFGLYLYMAPMLERIELTLELEQFLEEIKLENTEHGGAYLEYLWCLSPDYSMHDEPMETDEFLLIRDHFIQERANLSREIGAAKVKELEHHLGLNPQQIDRWIEDEPVESPFVAIDENKTGDVLMYIAQRIMADTMEDADDELDEDFLDGEDSQYDSVESLEDLIEDDESDAYGESSEWGDLGKPDY